MILSWILVVTHNHLLSFFCVINWFFLRQAVVTPSPNPQVGIFNKKEKSRFPIFLVFKVPTWSYQFCLHQFITKVMLLCFYSIHNAKLKLQQTTPVPTMQSLNNGHHITTNDMSNQKYVNLQTENSANSYITQHTWRFNKKWCDFWAVSIK